MVAPIAVFAFNRPEHLRRTLQSLMACQGFGNGPLTVFCDGPRDDRDRLAVAATLDVARELLGTAADIRRAPENQRIFRAITRGVSSVLDEHDCVIVLEDDLELAPSFLRFMNDALRAYADDAKVLQVSGYMFNVPEFADRDRAVMLPFTSSWGWATWSRAWAMFDYSAAGWDRVVTDHRLRRRFNLGGSYDYASMLRHQMVDDPRYWDWDIRWYLSVFRREGMVVFPPQSLVRNIGHDGTGVHGRALLRNFRGRPFGPDLADQYIDVNTAPCNSTEWRAVQRAIWRQNGGWLGSAVDLAKRMVVR